MFLNDEEKGMAAFQKAIDDVNDAFEKPITKYIKIIEEKEVRFVNPSSYP